MNQVTPTTPDDTEALLARGAPIALPIAAQPPSEIMWMPGGLQSFSATQSGKPVSNQVLVDRASAAIVQQDFCAFTAKSQQRPYFDFDHDDTAASAWPTGFRWHDGADGRAPGIYAGIEWSKPGAEAYVGKSYRSFSPGFFLTKDTPPKLRCALLPNMGGLVNNPGFKGMAPLWAKDPGATSSLSAAQPPQTTTGNNMDKNTTPGDSATAAAAQTDNTQAIQAKEAQIAQLSKTIEALQAKENSRRKVEADTAVKAAVARGALPPKDEAIQAKWRGLIEADPTHATLLDAMPSSPALSRVTSPGAVFETKDGPVEAFRAYKAKCGATAGHANEAAVIYAREIAPLFAKNPNFTAELGAILAANSLGALAGNLILQRALTLLKFEFPELRAFSTDFSSEPVSFGQTLQTRLRTVPVLTDYDPVAGYASSDVTTTDVNLTISAHKAVQIEFDANTLGSTKRDLIGEQIEGAHYAIGKGISDTMLALLIAANFPTPLVQAIGGFGRATLKAGGATLSKRGVPKVGRVALLNVDYHEAIGNDASIIQLATYQKPEIITDNLLPKIQRFQPYEVANMPTTANLVGFLGTPDALAVATRVPNDYTTVMGDVPNNGIVEIVTNPDSGISVMLVKFIDHRGGKAVWRAAVMWGAAKGQAGATGSGLLLSSA